MLAVDIFTLVIQRTDQVARLGNTQSVIFQLQGYLVFTWLNAVTVLDIVKPELSLLDQQQAKFILFS